MSTFGDVAANAAFSASSTVTKIATASGNGSVASLSFSSIPQTYAALLVRSVARAANGVVTGELKATFNDDATAYDSVSIQSNNSTVSTNWHGNGTPYAVTGHYIGASGDAGRAAHNELLLIAYAGTTWQKDGLWRTSALPAAATPSQWLTASGFCHWRNTAAISKITFTAAGNFLTGTEFVLYGIT